MYKLKLFLLPVAWLLAFMALACAPPDDDDASSGPTSGPAITSASYDVDTALLTVQGTDLGSAQQAQIQTIRVAGLALNSYTATATGVNSNGLKQGQYRIANDGTAIWLRLKDEHKDTLKATLNGKPDMANDGLKKGLLSVSSGSWAGLDTAKDLTVRNIPGKQSKTETEDKQSKTEVEEAEQVKETEEAEQTEQDQQAEEESPKAAITRAIYDVGTAILTVQGTHLSSATQAQIQTIKVYDLVLSSYIADGTATGPDSRSLTKGKYRMKSDGTALWLKLTDRHKAALEAKPGMNKDGRKVGLLSVGTGTWAGLNTAKDLTVSGNPDPVITRASYNVGTALLTLQGTDLGSATQAQIQTIKVYGVVLNSYTADEDATGPDSSGLAKGKYRMKSDGTALWLYLTDADKTTLNDKKGMDTNGLKDGLLSVGSGAWAGFDTAKALTVSGHPPAITSATYNIVTGWLVITGTNLPKTVTGWDFSKLRFVAGNGLESQPLKKHSTTGADRATGSAASGTFLVIILKGHERLKAHNTLLQNGLGDDGGAYNLKAAAGFAGGSAADTSNNPITVSGYTSSINTLYYYPNKGELVIYGNKLPTTVADWDFSKLTLVSGDGNKRYSLPKHATGAANTATGSKASRASLLITLSGSVKAEVDKILVKVGYSDDAGAYNLKAAAGFVTGNPEDLTTKIRVVD